MSGTNSPPADLALDTNRLPGDVDLIGNDVGESEPRESIDSLPEPPPEHNAHGHHGSVTDMFEWDREQRGRPRRGLSILGGYSEGGRVGVRRTAAPNETARAETRQPELQAINIEPIDGTPPWVIDPASYDKKVEYFESISKVEWASSSAATGESKTDDQYALLRTCSLAEKSGVAAHLRPSLITRSLGFHEITSPGRPLCEGWEVSDLPRWCKRAGPSSLLESSPLFTHTNVSEPSTTTVSCPDPGYDTPPSRLGTLFDRLAGSLRGAWGTANRWGAPSSYTLQTADTLELGRYKRKPAGPNGLASGVATSTSALGIPVHFGRAPKAEPQPAELTRARLPDRAGKAVVSISKLARGAMGGFPKAAAQCRLTCGPRYNHRRPRGGEQGTWDRELLDAFNLLTRKDFFPGANLPDNSPIRVDLPLLRIWLGHLDIIGALQFRVKVSHHAMGSVVEYGLTHRERATMYEWLQLSSAPPALRAAYSEQGRAAWENYSPASARNFASGTAEAVGDAWGHFRLGLSIPSDSFSATFSNWLSACAEKLEDWYRNVSANHCPSDIAGLVCGSLYPGPGSAEVLGGWSKVVEYALSSLPKEHRVGLQFTLSYVVGALTPGSWSVSGGRHNVYSTAEVLEGLGPHSGAALYLRLIFVVLGVPTSMSNIASAPLSNMIPHPIIMASLAGPSSVAQITASVELTNPDIKAVPGVEPIAGVLYRKAYSAFTLIMGLVFAIMGGYVALCIKLGAETTFGAYTSLPLLLAGVVLGVGPTVYRRDWSYHDFFRARMPIQYTSDLGILAHRTIFPHSSDGTISVSGEYSRPYTSQGSRDASIHANTKTSLAEMIHARNTATLGSVHGILSVLTCGSVGTLPLAGNMEHLARRQTGHPWSNCIPLCLDPLPTKEPEWEGSLNATFG